MTSTFLDRVTRGRGDKVLRFGMVSVVGVVITQALLVLFHGVLDLNGTLSNVLAVTLSSVPVFLLNKRWVWGQSGRSQVRREILPFWGFTLLGLALSTILVAIVDTQTDRTWPVLAANIAGFGIIWVAKFAFLDSIVFGRVLADEPPSA